ncbi:MAG: hypothetical protein IKF64_04760 [Eubacterium sp.]|nr:hypothetical protein [Eubacterium sp.]
MQNVKKRISAALAVIIALTFVLSVLFVVFESEHNCSGDDCQICQTVGNCLKILDNTTPKPETAVLSVAVIFALVLVLGTVMLRADSENLITLKVKLSN